MSRRFDSRRELERDFLAFRRHGDREALARVFRVAAPELRRIAGRLGRGRVSVDDAVQATFVHAITHREDFDASRRVLPWLIGILVNKVRTLRREGRRLVDQERVERERDRREDDPSRLCEDSEFRGLLRSAIEALPRDYREVVQRHLEQGQSPREISQELERPRGTVRSQLSRGLALLRRWLPSGLAIVLTGRQAVSGTRPRRTAVSVGSRAAVAGLVLTGIAALVASSTLQGTPPRVSSASTPAEAEVRSDPLASGVSGVRTPATAPSAPNPAEPRHSGTVEVRVLLADGTPLSGAVLSLVSDQPHGLLVAHGAVSDELGNAVFGGVSPGPHLLRTARGGALRIRVGAERREPIEFALPPGVRVEGTVLDAGDRPVAGGRIWLAPDNCSGDRGALVAECDATGRFALAGVGPGSVIAARAPGSTPSRVQVIEGPPDTTRTLTLRLGANRGGRLSGRVRNTNGEAVSSAVVVAGALGAMGPGPFHPTSVTRTDDAGRFDLRDLPHARIPVWVGAVGQAPWWTVTRVSDRPRELEVVLERPVTVTGTVRDEAGRPVPNALVDACFENLESCQFAAPGWAYPIAVSDVDGGFELTGVRPTVAAWRARCRGDGVWTDPEPRVPGAVYQWRPELPRRRDVDGRLVDERGAPLSDWVVSWSIPGSAHPPLQAQTDGNGRFGIPGCGPERAALAVRDPGSALGDPILIDDDVRALDTTQRFVVPDAALSTAMIRGRVLGSDERPFRGAVSALARDVSRAGPSVTGRLGDDGGYELGPLPPGRYALLLTVDDVAGALIREVEVGAEEVRDLEPWPLPRPAVVDIVPDGDPVPVEAVAVQTVRATFGRVHELAAGGALRILPGSYEISALGEGVGLASVRFTVAAGERRALSVEARAGRAVELVVPPFGHGAGELTFVWRHADGETRFFERAPWPPPPFHAIDEPVRRVLCFAEGSWHVEVRDRRGRRTAGSVQVTGEDVRATLPAWQ